MDEFPFSGTVNIRGMDTLLSLDIYVPTGRLSFLSFSFSSDEKLVYSIRAFHTCLCSWIHSEYSNVFQFPIQRF